MTKVFLTEGISSISRAILAGASIKELAARQGVNSQSIRNRLLYFLKNQNVKTCRGTALEKVKHILQNYECIMPPERDDVTGLTAREQEVLELFIKCGGDYGKTAQAAGIEISTIKTHFVSIFSKLHVNSKTAIVIKYFTEIKK